MDFKKLSLILMLAGGALVALSVVWFIIAYAGAMDMMGTYGGSDMSTQLVACLYSSPALCQGASFFGDGPSYSPVLFWIGVLALLAGAVVRLALKGNPGAAGAGTASASPSAGEGPLLGFIPVPKYTRTVYILVLIGAVGGLLLPPLAIAGLAAFVLGLLGLFVYQPRLSALDLNHLKAICAVLAAAFVLLWLARGSFLFLLIALLQAALFYVCFNSFRHGRAIGVDNFKEEARLALKPGERPSGDGSA